MSRRVNYYRTDTLNMECRIYGAELRKLLGFPVRQGKLLEASWDGDKLNIYFEQARSREKKL